MTKKQTQEAYIKPLKLDLAAMQRALSLLHVGNENQGKETEVLAVGNFMSFSTAFHDWYFRPPTSPEYEIMRNMTAILYDMANIDTLFQRIDWQTKLFQKDEISHPNWSRYTSLDMDVFFLEFRSIFDYAARVLRSIGKFPARKTKYFTDLADYLRKKPLADDKPIEKLVLDSEDWYNYVRDIRNEINHDNASSSTFYDKTQKLILIQVNKGTKRLITSTPELMHNENVVNFERFSSILFSYLVCFLEELAKVCFDHFKVPLPTFYGSRRHSPLILRVWLEESITWLKALRSA